MTLYALARDTGEALYFQIARQLEQEVLQNFHPGNGLPAEAELAKNYGVNRHTLRRAIDELVDSGLLERRHGKGVFVLDTYLDYQIGQGTRFTENLAAHGMQAEDIVQKRKVIPAMHRVAERLGIAVADPVVWIESVRTGEGRPLCVISHFLPAAKFPNLENLYEGGSLHALLKKEYRCSPRRTESFVTSLLPQGDDARLLSMPQNRPVLRVKSVNLCSKSGDPVEYSITRFRADRIQLRINP